MPLCLKIQIVLVDNSVLFELDVFSALWSWSYCCVRTVDLQLKDVVLTVHVNAGQPVLYMCDNDKLQVVFVQ